MPKNPKISIRPAKAEDTAGIPEMHMASIRGLCREHYSPKVLSGWAAPRKPEKYLKAMASGERMFVALAGTRVVGFSSVKKKEIYAVYVHPEFSGLGVGRRLLRAAESSVLKAGHRSVNLGSSVNGIGFYFKCGYRPVKAAKILFRNIGLQVSYLAMERRPGASGFIRVHRYRLDPRKLPHFLRIRAKADRLYRDHVPCRIAVLQDAADPCRCTEVHWGSDLKKYLEGLAEVDLSTEMKVLWPAFKSCLNPRHREFHEETWASSN